MKNCDCHQPDCSYCNAIPDSIYNILVINENTKISAEILINNILEKRKDYLEDKDLKVLLKYDEEIISHLKSNFEFLSFEYIIETLTHLGQAPNVLYDDNGNFAVLSSGYQSVCFGDDPMDAEMTFFVEKKFWFPTMREALNYYLSYEEDSDDE